MFLSNQRILRRGADSSFTNVWENNPKGVPKVMAETLTKHPHAQEVLVFLSQISEEHVSVEDVVAATQLGPVVYPVLSHLHEQGMIEPYWLQRVAGPQLNYQITLKGLESLRRMSVAEKSVHAAPKAKAILSKPKAVAKTDSSK
jgi:hypothetical protein